jgi:carbamoylphosphate synthase small subunit
MPSDEQRILITQAASGMVLSRPVALQTKVMLCARGSELNDATIARLMARGIKRIWVQGHPLPGPAQEDYAGVMRRLHERFSRVQHVPTMLGIQRAVERVLVRRV